MQAWVTITGRVGGDIEMRTSRQGMAVAMFRLACTPRVRRRGEWVDDETTWLPVTCFRGLAENVAASVSKGDPVLVQGRLRTQRWEREGEERERLVLEASVVGHDMAWGTSMFSRTERATSDDDAGDLTTAMLEADEPGGASSATLAGEGQSGAPVLATV